MSINRDKIPWDKTIVVDVDDTISTTINRDYAGAIPKLDIIDKLNALYNEGYRVVYSTARGQLSCKGDLNLIHKCRKPILETWLAEHDVLYDELKFGKPYGLMYIDDKSIRPSEFLNNDLETLIRILESND